MGVILFMLVLIYGCGVIVWFWMWLAMWDLEDPGTETRAHAARMVRGSLGWPLLMCLNIRRTFTRMAAEEAEKSEKSEKSEEK